MVAVMKEFFAIGCDIFTAVFVATLAVLSAGSLFIILMAAILHLIGVKP